MSVSKKRIGSSRHFQATRRRSGAHSTDDKHGIESAEVVEVAAQEVATSDDVSADQDVVTSAAPLPTRRVAHVSAHASAHHGEGSTGGGACTRPKRTFGRTYLSRGFSGYRRPKRPGTKGRYGVKNWSADDPLPNVTRPGLAEVSASTPTGTKATVVSTVTKRSGCRRSKRRGGMR